MLSGLAETLLQDKRNSTVRLTAWQREALQGIDQTAFHLVGLTDALLDAARLQAGRLELSCELIGPGGIVQASRSPLPAVSTSAHAYV